MEGIFFSCHKFLAFVKKLGFFAQPKPSSGVRVVVLSALIDITPKPIFPNEYKTKVLVILQDRLGNLGIIFNFFSCSSSTVHKAK